MTLMHSVSQNCRRSAADWGERQTPSIQVNPSFAEVRSEAAEMPEDRSWARCIHSPRQNLAAAQVFPAQQKQLVQTTLLAPRSFLLV
jgi:hypothetical protein